MGIYHGKHEKEREQGYARNGAGRIFTRGHGDFAKCGKMGKRYVGNSWRLVFLFFPKFQGWKRDMGHSWRCSKTWCILLPYRNMGDSIGIGSRNPSQPKTMEVGKA